MNQRIFMDRVNEERRLAGFTLIELLVVVAIIAVLVALMLPALNSAREQGKMIVCKNNLRHIGVGILMYGDEYNAFPRDTGYGSARWNQTLLPYLANIGWFNCPSSKVSISFGYNPNLGSGWVAGMERPDALNWPVQTLVVAGSQNCHVLWPWDISRTYLIDFRRHQGGTRTNELFADGHVESRTFEDTPIYLLYNPN